MSVAVEPMPFRPGDPVWAWKIGAAGVVVECERRVLHGRIVTVVDVEIDWQDGKGPRVIGFLPAGLIPRTPGSESPPTVTLGPGDRL